MMQHVTMLLVVLLVAVSAQDRCCCVYNAARPCLPAFPTAACHVHGFTCTASSVDAPTGSSPSSAAPTTASPTAAPTTSAPTTTSPPTVERCCCEWSTDHVCFPGFPVTACVPRDGYPKRCVGLDEEPSAIDRLINEPLGRRTGFSYHDGVSEPRGGRTQMRSAREISNAVFGHRETGAGLLQDPERTAFTIFWGQFVDHDLSITLFNGPDNCAEEFDIQVPQGDARFDAHSAGNKRMHFCRSDFVAGSGTGPSNPRQHANSLTPFLDASGVYGETYARAHKLRTLQGGLMKTSQGADGEFPPVNEDGAGGTLVSMINDAGLVPTSRLFATGDLRGNEQPVLLCLHTLMIREHNRRARLLAAANPSWTDSKIYHKARKWVIGHMQAITVNEWFPMFVGSSLGDYRGFDASVDPRIDAFFSTAALRVGHDGIPGVILRVDENNQEVEAGHLNLRDGFFAPDSTTSEGISSTLRGQALNPSQLMDAVFVDDIRDFLFAIEEYLATDLGARNLQRGRDHGVPDYNTVRRSYGLSACPSQDFACVTGDLAMAEALRELFGSTDMMDPYVAGLLERRRPGEKIGELFAVAIREQMDRIRHGDEHWFENVYAVGSAERLELDSTTLGDIIRRNTYASDISRHVFESHSNPILRKRRVTLKRQVRHPRHGQYGKYGPARKFH